MSGLRLPSKKGARAGDSRLNASQFAGTATSVGRIALTVQFAAATKRRGGITRYLAPAALAALVAAVVVVVVSPPRISVTRPQPAGSHHATARRLPAYWTVAPGDTYATVSDKTGLSIGQLEQLNPDADPYGLVPGEHLRLMLHPAAPRPRPLGPRFWTVRPGESFGLIADKTGINLAKLEQLNPRLTPTTLQPGDRVRLRR
jgi:LysM repeat protein